MPRGWMAVTTLPSAGLPDHPVTADRVADVTARQAVMDLALASSTARLAPWRTTTWPACGGGLSISAGPPACARSGVGGGAPGWSGSARFDVRTGAAWSWSGLEVVVGVVQVGRHRLHLLVEPAQFQIGLAPADPLAQAFEVILRSGRVKTSLRGTARSSGRRGSGHCPAPAEAATVRTDRDQPRIRARGQGMGLVHRGSVAVVRGVAGALTVTRQPPSMAGLEVGPIRAAPGVTTLRGRFCSSQIGRRAAGTGRQNGGAKTMTTVGRNGGVVYIGGDQGLVADLRRRLAQVGWP